MGSVQSEKKRAAEDDVISGIINDVTDINIEIDFSDIEDDVSSRVSSLLGKNNDDD